MTISAFTDQNRFLSNFWPCQVAYRGLSFSSTEAAYQAQKCAVDSDKPPFQHLAPGTAKRLGRSVRMRPDWDSIKVQVMTELIALKFAEGSDLAAKLLATGDEELVEGNYWNDRFWGVCGGRGENQLGKILMARRSELRNNHVG